MKRGFFYLLITILSNSCVFYNRMTSPEILEKEEQIWTFGLSVDPLEIIGEGELDYEISIIQPVIGYRTGISLNHELGFTLYGVYTPGLVIDYKHKYYEHDNFNLTGDLALFGGYIRPIGLQYDLLFGNRKLYGVLGVSYDILELYNDKPMFTLGIGSERIGKSPFGMQLTYTRNLEKPSHYVYNFISIGLKYDLLNIKKRYR